MTGRDKEGAAWCRPLRSFGAAAPAIGKTLSLGEVNEAFGLLAERKVRGKVVLDLRHDLQS